MLTIFCENMKTKPHASSDPQIPMDRQSPLTADPDTRFMVSVSGDMFDGISSYQRASTYGSVNDHAACCVAGEHFLTSHSQDFINRSLSMDSVVNVDISDINGDCEARIVPLSLRKCQNQILKPYTLLLSLVGWRPWCKERYNRCSWCLRFFNYLYPLIVLLFMLYHFVFQVLSCQGKYDINVCTKIPKLPEKGVTKSMSFMQVHFAVKYSEQKDEPTAETICCQHIIPAYVVPAVMHFLAYGYGFLHFRIQECEQLYALMERVFLQAQNTPGMQKALIRNSRFYMFGAVLWLFGQIALEVLFYKTVSVKSIPITNDKGSICRLESFAYDYLVEFLPLKFIGMFLMHCVNVAVLVNYCTQCEMLVCYIKRICLSLHERSIQIKAAMHEILGVREYISLLNGNVGKMTACCIFIFGELTIIGTTALIFNRNYASKLCICRIIFYVLIFGALLLPLIQAARLSRTGCKLRQISFEMRVFGYQNASQLELDSFVLFVNGATLRAKLFGVAIRTASIMFTFGAAALVLLTLMVIDIFPVSGYQKIL